ncbi:Histone-lysine N-methyltransferase set9 [Zancudomyces culisetae]|uniref:Histone-lysine N-methyltransferase set9 n=1 Tax=Zancudomyces culisetae TaxID=1213189 RepID=A0A1R1PWM6_ZANCU|nr:Histone-lysine N-methyltransferase set9 [Zancudomyces culisetae]|eukprot:OMH85344.1 Histone-lysine N-methyltransferase set9 [Zancudomyces culisetae]
MRISQNEILQVVRSLAKGEKGLSDTIIEFKGIESVDKALQILGKKQLKEIIRQAELYFSMYLPEAGYEISESNRYEVVSGHVEGCVLATKDYETYQLINYCTGTMTKLEEGDICKLENSKSDFSVMWWGKKKSMCLLLGPARFVNHDCNPNCKFITFNNGLIGFQAVRKINVGEEITASYGKDYFGVGNCECLCQTCEIYGKGYYSTQATGELDGNEVSDGVQNHTNNTQRRTNRRRAEAHFSAAENDKQQYGKLCENCKVHISSVSTNENPSECVKCKRHKMLFGFDWPFRTEMEYSRQLNKVGLGSNGANKKRKETTPPNPVSVLKRIKMLEAFKCCTRITPKKGCIYEILESTDDEKSDFITENSLFKLEHTSEFLNGTDNSNTAERPQQESNGTISMCLNTLGNGIENINNNANINLDTIEQETPANVPNEDSDTHVEINMDMATTLCINPFPMPNGNVDATSSENQNYLGTEEKEKQTSDAPVHNMSEMITDEATSLPGDSNANINPKIRADRISHVEIALVKKHKSKRIVSNPEEMFRMKSVGALVLATRIRQNDESTTTNTSLHYYPGVIVDSTDMESIKVKSFEDESISTHSASGLFCFIPNTVGTCEVNDEIGHTVSRHEDELLANIECTEVEGVLNSEHPLGNVHKNKAVDGNMKVFKYDVINDMSFRRAVCYFEWRILALYGRYYRFEHNKKVTSKIRDSLNKNRSQRSKLSTGDGGNCLKGLGCARCDNCVREWRRIKYLIPGINELSSLYYIFTNAGNHKKKPPVNSKDKTKKSRRYPNHVVSGAGAGLGSGIEFSLNPYSESSSDSEPDLSSKSNGLRGTSNNEKNNLPRFKPNLLLSLPRLGLDSFFLYLSEPTTTDVPLNGQTSNQENSGKINSGSEHAGSSGCSNGCSGEHEKRVARHFWKFIKPYLLNIGDRVHVVDSRDFKLYKAKIEDIEFLCNENKWGLHYYVHFLGWSAGFDQWVPPSCIVLS